MRRELISTILDKNRKLQSFHHHFYLKIQISKFYFFIYLEKKYNTRKNDIKANFLVILANVNLFFSISFCVAAKKTTLQNDGNSFFRLLYSEIVYIIH